MREERLRILQMIAEGTVTAEQGAELLDALDAAALRDGDRTVGRPSWLRIRASNVWNGQTLVNLALPVSVLEAGVLLGGRPGRSGRWAGHRWLGDFGRIDLAEILAALRRGARGKVVDVEDSARGHRVEVWFE